MLWKIPNGNYLLRSRKTLDDGKLISIFDCARYYCGETATKFLAQEIFKETGEFYEIELNRLPESEVDTQNFYQENAGKIIKHYRRPSTFSLEDYLYLNDLYVVEDGNFLLYSVSEKACETYDTEIRVETVFENLVPVTDDFLPKEYLKMLLNDYRSSR